MDCFNLYNSNPSYGFTFYDPSYTEFYEDQENAAPRLLPDCKMGQTSDDDITMCSEDETYHYAYPQEIERSCAEIGASGSYLSPFVDESKRETMSRVVSKYLARRHTQKESLGYFLDRDLTPLSKLSHEKFKQLVLFLKKKLYKHPLDGAFFGYISDKLHRLYTERTAFYNSNIFSICDHALRAFGISSNDFFHSPQSAWIPSRKEELNQLVSLFFLCPLFSWDLVEDGCYSRADLMIQILLALGVPSDRISKQYILANKEIQTNQATCAWDFHVAVKILLPDGQEWILDPLLSSDQALSLSEWCSRPIIDLPSRSVIDCGHLNTGHGNLFFHDSSNGETFDIVLFSSEPNTSLYDFDTEADHYEVEIRYQEYNIHTTLSELAFLRNELERKWIERLINPTIPKESLDWLKDPAPLILQEEPNTSDLQLCLAP